MRQSPCFSESDSGISKLIVSLLIVAFIAASLHWQKLPGQAFVIFIFAVAAAEVAIGLALIVHIQRRTGSVMADDYNQMKG